MNKTNTLSTEQTRKISEHYIGEIKGNKSGPILIAMAGTHGNEISGIAAIQQALEILKPLTNKLKGHFIGIKGNISALKKEIRYNSEDMNRLWERSILDKIRRTPYNQLASPDRAEIKDLLQILDPLVLQNKREVIFIDLHTFSGKGGMFCITPDNQRNMEILEPMSVPLIFGIEKALKGTSIEYLEKAGHIGVAFETGTHATKEAEEAAFSGLITLLVSTGLVEEKHIPDFNKHQEYLKERCEGYPKKLRYLYKHIVEPGDGFAMKPGYQNYDKISKGDILAEDKNGYIEAQVDGFMLMPLYQEQGSDGFFIIEECE